MIEKPMNKPNLLFGAERERESNNTSTDGDTLDDACD